MRFRIFFCLLIFSINACVTGRLRQTPNGYWITKNKKFRLRDQFRLPDTTVLSTACVYRQSCSGEAFFKFYANGKVIYGAPTDKKGPKPGTYIDTTYDLAGFYKLDGRNLTTELSYGFTGNDWTVLVSRAKISGDTIIFYKDQVKGWGKNWNRFANLRKLNGERCYFVKSWKQDRLLPPDW
jgi:hypothetical protein